jgi:hypothetical protein
MTTRTHLRVFISSPSDVPDERAKAFAVIHSLNRQIGDVYNITLEPVAWETHVAPDMGKPQAIINKQIGDYDIFVGIKTDTAGSGTEEEFNIAYKNWQTFKRPRIMFYFCVKPYAPATIKEIAQWGTVLKFKTSIGKKGLYREYQNSDDFQDLLRDHIIEVIKEQFKPLTDVYAKADFTAYLKFLRSETMYMDIRGLASGEARAHQFLIDELYLPLKTGSMRQDELKTMPHGQVLLQESLREKRLVIKGEPGAGKTTFLRLLAYTLCQT